jgi:parallel beta-helix repeat protein
MKTNLLKLTKSTVLYFLFSCLILVPISAQTDLSGTISLDSTLNVSGSPYIVTSNLDIRPGATLTIESGVTLKFNANVNMYVNGTLTATNVTFTSNNPSPQPGSWGQIQTGDYYNAGTVSMTGCNIMYSQRLYVYNGASMLLNTTVSNSSLQAICVEASGILNMTGGSLSTSNTDAINYYDGIYANSNSTITLSGILIQNYRNGIALEYNTNTAISGMTINSCNYPICYNNFANLTVRGVNNFAGNNYTAVKINFNELYNSMTLPIVDIPYFFPWFTVHEGSTLTVGSSNILKFQNGTGLNVAGTLVAKAHVGENIYFTTYQDDNWGGDTNKDGTSTAPQSQNWYGINFNDASNNAGCVLRRCMVRYAGASNKGGISTLNASPTIDSCTISNNYIGIYMQGTSNPVLTNNTIGSSQMTPIAMSFEANPVMRNNTMSFSDNAYDAIGIIGGTLTANATLKIRSVTTVPNMTYLLLDEITIPSDKTLIINKGITIKSFSNDWYNHRIIVNGSFIANATADSIINFTSARDDNYGYPADCNKDGTISSPVVGDWGGLIFNSGSSGTMNYCRIKYAKINSFGFSTCSNTEYINNTAVGIIDASPTISNCEFKDLQYAISCYRSASPTLMNNSMVNIQYTPINISGPSNPTISGITFTNVGWRAMGLLGGNVCLNGTIKKLDVAGFTNISYVLLSDMTINSGTFVNVEPGVVIKVNNPSGGSSIFVDGGLKTDGTAGQRVVFTSIKDDNAGNPGDSNGDGNASTPAPGDWGSIKYRSTSDDDYSKFRFVDVKYAGNTNEGGVTFENASGQLKNALITNTSNYGVYCNGNSTPVIDSLVVQNCSLDPIAISLTSNPDLRSNISFISNKSKAIKIIEGTLSTVASLASRNVAGINNIAYIVSNLTISSNAKLTIQPGVVIKFRQENWWQSPRIDVKGNLIAKGTSSNKIYFTSYADDSRGGDSNNDGNSTSPTKGDWGSNDYYASPLGGIRFLNNSLNADSVNYLKNCEISYPATGVRLENSHAKIDSCLIQLCGSYGATIIGSANPDIKNSQFYNIGITPVELSMFSNPVFTNCSALNIGYMALTVIPETYSQSAVIPIRNFAGYNNISYFMEGTCTVNSGTTITIPAGVVFKSATGSHGEYYTGNHANGFSVNGRLEIQGTKLNPVVFTNAADDNYGNPKDMNQNGSATLAPDGYNQGWSGNWVTFNDVSDDASTINNAIFKYGNVGTVAMSASPTIKNVHFENLYCGVDMNGVSAPKIDSCIFHNLQYVPIQISLVSYPVSTVGNVISGSTYKVIKVRDEVLTQDVTLPKRNFGGKNNIPYYFNNYSIGTSASLNIAPGVICKFQRNSYWENSKIDISKGLTALGGSTPDSIIVFTNIKDDFYGGDSNSDNTATKSNVSDWNSSWTGLNFTDQSLDPLCKLRNCVIRFADAGVLTTSASPTIDKCNFNNNNYGVKATAASNPVLTNCDFSENTYYAVDNVDKSFTIDANQCWWGSNSGPILCDINPSTTVEQQYVTSNVNYSPWKTAGALNPIMGDVSLNGLVQAYDASLVLKHAVSLITLSAPQQQVADVSGTGGITAYDASLILQYVVGMDATFQINKVKKSVVELNNVALSIGNATVSEANQSTVIPLVATMDGMLGADIVIRFNPFYLQAVGIENLLSSMFMEFKVDNVNGLITIGMARTVALNGSGTLANLKFNVIAPNSVVTDVSVDKFLINEQDFTYAALSGSITIMKSPTALSVPNETIQGMDAIYPNPFVGEGRLTYHLDDSSKWIRIDVFNMLGQKVTTLTNQLAKSGTYSIQIMNKEYPFESGAYIVRMQTANYTHSQVFQVRK